MIALRSLLLVVSVLGSAPSLAAQAPVPSPKDVFGFAIGDDYHLATYDQLTEYWHRVDASSDRVRVLSIGKTAEGRDQWMAIVTSPKNFERLDRLRLISEQLSRARDLTADQARALAKEGVAVVWIDGGLHATEVLGAHQLIEHLYQMASRNDEETLRILDDVVQLVVHANPDGMALVSDWYMRRTDPAKRSLADLPRLYQKYIGHDNNRDFYLNAMPESKNVSRVMYRQWYPQIMYNHHQTGPAGAVMFAPPFRDPHNYFLDPILINSLNMVGTAMHTRFAAEDKPGVVQRESASYQTWWNGGLRTTAYFHNQIGILTETIGSPTPITIPLVPSRLLADGNGTFPIMPQPWKFRQSIDYSITANRAILDYASRYREQLLYNIFLMGKSAIEKGSRDTWTVMPRRVAAMEAAAAKDGRPRATEFGERTIDPEHLQRLRQPADRDPRGYVIPADQPDLLTATKFVNALIESGIEVQRATAPFAVGTTQYPSGSYVIRSAQAFRAHVLDMMEPQDYPNDIPYPGGSPKAPYDNAGYTLALQMGIRYDRQLEGFDCPCVPVDDVLSKPPVTATFPPRGPYLLARNVNDAYLAVNRLLAAKQVVRANGHAFGVAATPVATKILRELAETRGLPVGAGPLIDGKVLTPARVGVWDQYGGSIPAGWVRWIMEQFEFPFERVFAPRLDQGNLAASFDVLVFVSGAIPPLRPGQSSPPRNPIAMEDFPAQYRDQVGRISANLTIPALKAFAEQGGRIVTIGESTILARHFGLPVENHLVERTPDGTVRPIPPERFFVPASLLQVAIDSTTQSAAGMASSGIVMFDQSPVFRLLPDAPSRGIRPVAWFATPEPLRSGWAWGQTYLDGGVAAIEARVGNGTLYLFGPEITFRAQPHGTFRFLFNAIFGN